MTIAELSKAIGTAGYIIHEQLHVSVKVLDVKQSYGRVRYLVAPLAGTGTIWVETFVPYGASDKGE